MISIHKTDNKHSAPTDGANQWKLEPEDFQSFWTHYRCVQDWVQMAAKAHQGAISGHSNVSITSDVQASLIDETDSQTHNVLLEQGNEAMEVEKEAVDEGISADYLEFVRQTEEHRKKRDEEKKLKGNNKHNKKIRGKFYISDDDEDDYVLASEVGVFGVKKRTTKAPDRRKEAAENRAKKMQLYGPENYERIVALESELESVFTEHFLKHRPIFWPNIPLRFPKQQTSENNE